LKLDLLRALPLALIACAVGLFAIFGRPVPAEPPVEEPATVGSIDFDALHRQASTALESLRQSRQRTLAPAAADAS
jgi:hypothetical protein